MNLKKTYLEDDMNRNWKRLKRRLTMKIVGLFSIVMIIPIVLFYLLSSSFVQRILYEDFDRKLEIFKNSKIEIVNAYYSSVKEEMKNVSERIKVEGSEVDYSFLKEYASRLNLENIYIYDSNFKVLNEIGVLKRLPTEELIGQFFSSEFKLGKYIIDKEDIYQNAFFKFFIDGNPFYIVFEISPDGYQEKLLRDKTYEYDLLNDEFYVISSSDENKINDIEINEVTKKLLDGYAGVESVKGTRYSYSYVDAFDSPLYIQVYDLEDGIYSRIGKLRYYLVIVVFISLMAGFLAIWNMRKSAIRYSESAIRIGIEQEGDRRYPYIKEEMLKIFEELENVIKSIEYLREYNERIKNLKKRIEEQNRELKEHMEDRNYILGRIRSDEEIKRDFIDEIIREIKKEKD